MKILIDFSNESLDEHERGESEFLLYRHVKAVAERYGIEVTLTNQTDGQDA